MRIAINYTAAIRQRVGLGLYIRNLVSALLSEDTENQYTLVTHERPTNTRLLPTADNSSSRYIAIPERYLHALRYQWHLPLTTALLTGPCDIYHSPDFVLPPLKKEIRTVVTIHDLAFLEHPEYSLPPLTEHLQKTLLATLSQADVVVAVSQDVRRALIKHYSLPPEKIPVIPTGVASHFRRITDPIILDATRHKFGLKQPFLLTVGTQERHKNQLGLIKAFYQLANKKKGSAMLVIAGADGGYSDEAKRLVGELRLEKKVRFLGYVNDIELLSLYSMADVFVLPSFFEGFSVTPLEAMACGAPVIAANTSSLPEVVGDAALLVDPSHIDELAKTLTRLLADVALQETLRQKGYARAKLYTWSRSAYKILNMYQSLYQGAVDFTNEVELL